VFDIHERWGVQHTRIRKGAIPDNERRTIADATLKVYNVVAVKCPSFYSIREIFVDLTQPLSQLLADVLAFL
jgi:hypothetical protein